MKVFAVSLLIVLVASATCTGHQRCSKVALHAWCSANLTTDLARVHYECERDFTFHERRCRVDEQGDFCGSFVDNLEDIEKAKAACLNESSCSRECYKLLHTLRKDLGCCINEILNTTIGPRPHRNLFNYFLWRNCNLDIPPQNCLPSRLTKYSKPQVTKQCSFHEFYQKRYRVQCNNSTITALANDYDAHGCHQVSRDLYDTCSVTEEGVWCVEKFLKNLTSTVKFFRAARSHCTGAGCTPGCRDALIGIKANLGCCINNLFNNSYVRLIYSETSFNTILAHYEVWKNCGVTHPCSCVIKTYSNGAASSYHMTAAVLLITVVILLSQ